MHPFPGVRSNRRMASAGSAGTPRPSAPAGSPTIRSMGTRAVSEVSIPAVAVNAMTEYSFSVTPS